MLSQGALQRIGLLLHSLERSFELVHDRVVEDANLADFRKWRLWHTDRKISVARLALHHLEQLIQIRVGVVLTDVQADRLDVMRNPQRHQAVKQPDDSETARKGPEQEHCCADQLRGKRRKAGAEDADRNKTPKSTEHVHRHSADDVVYP